MQDSASLKRYKLYDIMTAVTTAVCRFRDCCKTLTSATSRSRRWKISRTNATSARITSRDN